MPLQNLKNTWKSIRENAESGNRKKGRAVYEEFKYMLQDVNRIYIGAKYTYRELMEHPETAFKFKSVIEHYLLKDTDPDTSLESDFYYMRPDSFSYRTYEQLKVKCRISVLTEKKGARQHPGARLQGADFIFTGTCGYPVSTEKKGRNCRTGDYFVENCAYFFCGLTEKSLINVEKSGIVWIAGGKRHKIELPAVIKLVKFPFYTEQVRVCALPVLLNIQGVQRGFQQ